ncbi:hypothetical protein SAMN05444274_104356 [Mariniphaga anaerophila]|uniref:HprK-related kinase A n=1 Tax=Mariniphaga anaerophila TaxID=1484053 RepID=A0A1M5AJC9_9BACT|nr:hypothetical protein [Mariniphaga anaerophila]SHF30420.1 hypothetical protein SAMN05444274_104356 [Mariniphaga anaerophila]
MQNILFVKKKVGESYLIWFQNSNLFFYLQEPAWYVFNRIVNRHKVETIAEKFAARYSVSYDESLTFVTDIRKKAEEMNLPFSGKRYFETHKKEIIQHSFKPYSEHCYSMFNKVVKFSFETLELERFIHPMAEHLKAEHPPEAKFLFELFTHNGTIILRVNNVLKGSWTKNESEFVKGRVFVELINILHNKTEADWLMTVHASAISNGKKTILFSASPGSGKTTFAALLKANGYQIISDDFVPIEQNSFNAYPLPLAMSVKEGSVDLLKNYFPELKTAPSVDMGPKKKVRYLPVGNEIIEMTFPVNEFIFIKYDKTVDFRLEKIEPVEALKTLLDEAWIPASPKNIEVFLEKILNISYYSLTYSDNQKALNAITGLFNND